MPRYHVPKLFLGIILLAMLVDSTGYVAHANQNVVVVLDDSGSMDSPMRSRRDQKKIDAAKSALRVVLGQLPADARIGILLLNGTTQGSPWVIPLGPVNVEQARAALRQVRADGGTPLGEKMKEAADALLQQRSLQHYGDYRLLIVTDGEATDGRLVERYLPDILSRGLTVDVIGVDMSSDHSLATQVHSYRRADDPESLERAVRAVFAETSAVDDDSQNDFQLLEGFPSEVAAAALVALAEAGNEPIGATNVVKRRAWERAGGRRQAPAKKPGSSWLFFLIVLMIISVALSALKKKRRG